MLKRIGIILFLFLLTFRFFAVAEENDASSSSDVPISAKSITQSIFEQGFQEFDKETFSPASPSPLKTAKAYGSGPAASMSGAGSKGLSAVDPARYRLEPGDMLSLEMWTPLYTTMSVIVNPEGNINLPPVGEIPVKGVALDKLSNSLHENLLKYYKRVSVTANLTDVRTMRIQVLGEVSRPGSYQVSGTTGVMDAVELAGGLSERGSLRQIELRDNDKAVTTLDYFRWRIFGDIADNPYLNPNAIVYIPVLKNQVSINGEVKRPGAYEILPGETFRDLVAMAGGYTSEAMISQTKLSRFTGAGVSMSGAPPEKLALQDGDRIHVPSTALFEKKIKVVGEIQGTNAFTSLSTKLANAPQITKVGWYRLHENERLRDVIVNLGGITPNADAARVRVERKTSSGVQVIPVNIQKLLAGNDESQNVLMQDQDTLIIPPVSDSIYVLGEVHRPGVLPYSPGDQIREYLALAGGPTRNARLAHAQLIRIPENSTNPQVYPVNLEHVLKGEKLSQNLFIQPGDVIYVPRTEITSFSDLLGVIGNISIVRAIFFK